MQQRFSRRVIRTAVKSLHLSSRINCVQQCLPFPLDAALLVTACGETSSLSRSEVTRILQKTAATITASACRRSDALECSAGLLDIDARLKAAIQGLPPEPPVQDYSLTIPAETLTLERGSSKDITVPISRVGGFAPPISLAFECCAVRFARLFHAKPCHRCAKCAARGQHWSFRHCSGDGGMILMR